MFSMQRKVSNHPNGSYFVYLPKLWCSKQFLNGWDGKRIDISPSSKLIIQPYPNTLNENFVTSKTPFRLPFGGGGSDIPEYYEKNGEGFWISGAINHYIHVILKKRFEKESKFVWSKTEYVKDVSEFEHPILQAVLPKYDLTKHVELISIGDLPARIGLGSSGSFTVGLLNAVHNFKKINVISQSLAEEAYEIERFSLGRKIGKQDQYIATTGGLREFHVNGEGKVTSENMKTSLKLFNKWLLLFFVNRRTIRVDKAIQKMSIKDYETTSSLTNRIYDSLQSNNFEEYGKLLNEHWNTKKKSQPKKFDYLIGLAKRKGAIGGKLCGAGGGGCIMLVCPPEKQTPVIDILTRYNSKQIPFEFTQFGSEVY